MSVQSWEELRQKAAEKLDLPGDIAAGLPRVEVVGNGEFWMEGHRGILSYGEEEICISGGRVAVRLRGAGLELRSMNANTLCITGRIAAVELT